MARIFQDAAGTTPVTTYDQPVGKIVRGAGTVDLVQSVSGSRLTMARWPRGGRRNLLLYTENLTHTPEWSKTPTASWEMLNDNIPGTAIKYMRLDIVQSNSVFVWQDFYTGVTSIIEDGKEYTISEYARSDHPNLTSKFGGFRSPFTVIQYSDEWQRFDFTFTAVNPGDERLWFQDGRSNPTEVSGTIFIGGVQFELGDNVTPYQRVTTANDVTEEGVESLWHLYNDGGDSLQTDGPVPAGTYGYAYVDPYGEITFDTRESDGINPVVVADDPGRYLDIILREGDFTAGEKDQITDYWERRYK